MKKLLLVILVLVGNYSALAADVNEYKCKSDYIIAEYQISQLTTGHHQQQSQLKLIRNGKRVAQFDNQSRTADVWYLTKAKKLQLTRLFEAFSQGIEYQPSEIGQSSDWMGKWSLISSSLLEQMHVTTTTGEGCEQVMELTLASNDYQISLTWLPNLELIQRYKVTHSESGEVTKLIELKNKSINADKVKELFKQWDGLKTTDYADVGDSENNPFLAKMINQGFAGQPATFATKQSEHNHSH